MSKGNYDRLVSKHSRELLEGTVGAVARSAREYGVDKGIRKERERILALLEHEETRSVKDFFGAHQSKQCVTCRNIERIQGKPSDD
jgi:hypothetical protein